MLAQLSRYLFGDVANNDANGLLDDSLKIGVFNICLALGTTHSAEIVEDQIDIPVDAGDD